jgi:ribokinase
MEASAMLKHVDIITPNESEATLLIGRTVYDIPSAIMAGKELVRQGCHHAIVTLGSRGCVVVNEQVTHVEAIPVQAVDTTAAGDAFNGTLALALAEGKDLDTATRWANIAASLSVTRRGAQPSLPDREEIDKKLASLITTPPPIRQ